jgi:hypothetical protein
MTPGYRKLQKSWDAARNHPVAMSLSCLSIYAMGDSALDFYGLGTEIARKSFSTRGIV